MLVVTETEDLQYPTLPRRIAKACAGLDANASTNTEMLRPSPPHWSILRRTIPGIFRPRAETCHTTLTDPDKYPLCSLGLPDEDWAKLSRAAVYKDDSLYVVLALSIAYLMHLQLDQRTIDTMIDTFVTLCERPGSFPTRRSTNASPTPIISTEEISNLSTFRIDSFDVPRRLVNDLIPSSMVLWKDLADRSELDVLETSPSYAQAFKTIDALWQMKVYGQLASSLLDRSESCTDFDKMARDYIHLTTTNRINETIVLGRLGLLDGGKHTLQGLGALCGLTRERIRQRELKQLSLLRSSRNVMRLARFRLAITEHLQTSGGVCLISELASGLAMRLGWKHEPEAESFAAFVELFGGTTVDAESGLVYDSAHRCYNCSKVPAALEDIFAEDQTEKSLSDAARLIQLACAKTPGCGQYCASLSLSEGFISAMTAKTDTILLEGRVLLVKGTLGSKTGTRVHLVENILKDAKRAMHFSEVHAKVKTLIPDNDTVTEHNVHSWLGRAESVLLWDRGTFIHCDYVSIPRDLVIHAELWLLEKLKSGVPFVCISGVYGLLKNECGQAGITSESALYTCLRRWGTCEQLCYPRYPQVYLKDGFDSRIPAVSALEQFIRDAGGNVPYQVLREFALDDLCLKEFQFQQCLARLANVARTADGSFIHARSLKVDFGKLEPLKNHILELLRDNDHISVTKIFTDKLVTCTMVGIDSPEMLYSILRLMATDEYELPSYPHVRRCVALRDHKANLITDVSDYVRQKHGPCSFDELEARFVQELGYSYGGVYAAVSQEHIVRYGRGTVVHLDTLDWSDVKQRDIESLSLTALDNARKAGRCYARVTDLLECSNLPSLAYGISWTQTLLSEILGRCGRVRILGTSRNAFVAFPSSEGIKSFEELAHAILASDYAGASDLTSFEEHLRQLGIIRKRITPEMLGSQAKVSISGHVIMLAELFKHA